MLSRMTFDHELKIKRAYKHLQDLNAAIGSWVEEKHYRVREEFDPEARWPGPISLRTAYAPGYRLAGAVFPGGVPHVDPIDPVFGKGVLTVSVTAEQPPLSPISLLIGDALHNLRSALDLLAFALANAYTKPLPEEVADRSEFPIFGDEDGHGGTGVGSARFYARTKAGKPAHGSGLAKISGWHPVAQAIVEGLQPYKRGDECRSHPLWVLHELDRISKHRLLHTTATGSAGTGWDVDRTRNVACIGPGFIQPLGGLLQTDTPVIRYWGVHVIDPDREVKMEVQPVIEVVFDASVANAEPVAGTMAVLYGYITEIVLPALTPYL